MPFYTFHCETCEEIFDVRATFKEKEEGLKPACPKCQSRETKQVITAGLFIRDGDGGGTVSFPGCGPSAGPGCC